ncbi:hypothetical protein HHI36_020227 [Cryptolaemus montrouzieri]|uniref:Complement component 1 Q subcomponent-binding protein, mitochondrial n=1 Tax=Cryptolaemus montrouzieri TaxID=559131 RepID=A0ABD2NA34_9CUCU
MNNILKAARTFNTLKALLNPAKQIVFNTNVTQQHRQIARNLWYMSNNSHHKKITSNHSHTCSCGCGKSGVHTKAEKELVEFLTEEILAERKAQKAKTIPTELDGFKAKLNGAEVTLTKESGDESIQITFNVNHTVDTDVEADVDPSMDKPDLGELKSKPSFKVEIVRGSTTLSLLCSFVSPGDEGGEYNDIFGIDEISIYEGDWNENVYAVSGEVVDSYLYDLILNYLEEKGISNEFVEKISEYSTAFEHSAYIGLLESLSKFASGK